ncbi:MAG: hypothetical protein AAF653_21475 [Chloroflexota bacterium]
MKPMILWSLLVVTVAGCSVFSGDRLRVPDYPVFPDSRLTKSETINESQPVIMSFTYDSRADWREVITFFEDNADCRITDDLEEFICHGEMPEGDFIVYVQEPRNFDTFYTVEVSWFVNRPAPAADS